MLEIEGKIGPRRSRNFWNPPEYLERAYGIATVNPRGAAGHLESWGIPKERGTSLKLTRITRAVLSAMRSAETRTAARKIAAELYKSGLIRQEGVQAEVQRIIECKKGGREVSLGPGEMSW